MSARCPCLLCKAEKVQEGSHAATVGATLYAVQRVGIEAAVESLCAPHRVQYQRSVDSAREWSAIERDTPKVSS